MKRLLGFLLVCLVLVQLAPLSAQAGEFAIDPETGILTGYSGTGGLVSVPETVDGIRVRAIGSTAFSQNASLLEVVLPEGLTHILDNAFYFCENLETVRFPSTLQAIDGYAFFSNKKLTQVSLPASLVYIGSNAFAYCEALADVTLAGGLTMFDDLAFEAGPKDRRFTVPEGAVEAYKQVLAGQVLPGKEGSPLFGQPVFEVDSQGSITGYQGGNAFLDIPQTLDGQAVTGIADRAFYTEPWLRVLRLPEGVAFIGKEAFFATKLRAVRFPDSLTAIGDDAFSGAPLMALELPGQLTTLGVNAFANARFRELYLPASLEAVPEGAFSRNWQLETLGIPAGIKTIGSKAFLDNDKLSYIIFDAAVAPAMAADAFAECDAIVDIDIAHDASRAQALAFEDAFAKTGVSSPAFKVWRAYHPNAPAFVGNLKMTFDEATQLVTSYSDTVEKLSMYFNFWKADGSATLDILGVGEGAFEGSVIREFYVPRSDAFTTIGARAFKGSSLAFIDLFDTVTEIGEEAFAGCVNLTEIAIPGSVRAIGANAFQGCDNLRELVLPADVQLAGGLGLPAGKIRVAADATDTQLAALRAALGLTWDEELLRVGEASARTTMPEGLTASPEKDFEFDAASGTVTRYIGQDSTVIVPRSIGGVPVTGIGFTAFSDLTVYAVLTGGGDNLGLTEVILPDTVRAIGDSAFLNCKTLKRVDIYGPVDSLGIRAFENCLALEAVHFHNGIREMGIYAFNLCGNLREVTLGNQLSAIPEGAFVGCGLEGTLTLSAPVIGNLAFQNNAKVTGLRILGTVTDIGEAAFRGMSALETVTFERADASVLGEFRYQFDDTATEMKINLPGSSGEEAVAAFVQKMNQNMLPGESMVQRVDLPELPGAPEAAPQQAEAGAEETVALQPAQGPQPPLGRYRCVKAGSGGVSIDLAAIGEYAVDFLQDGTAVLTVGGTDFPPLPMALDDGVVTLDYFGQQYVFKPLPDGGYELDFMGAMTLVFQKE